MGLTCNIDQRGRKARIIAGAVFDGIGCALVAGGLLTDTTWMWIAGAAMMLGGGFMIFEGAVGWCAMRAMGFKTKM